MKTYSSIFVYNKSYEKSRLKDLSEQFPAYKDRIETIIENIWDLMVMFQKKYYYKPEMLGSNSIKDVFPAMVPGLSYDNLEIIEGGTASAQFLKMVREEDTEESNDRIRENLLEYCKMDTYSMVRLLASLS